MVEYKTTNPELSLFVEEQLLTKLYHIGMKYYPKEYGGILLGFYSQAHNLLTITDTILPKSFESNKTRFIRGTKGLQNELDILGASQPSTKYVGEWHTHPDMPAIPSPTDKVAMKNIANDPDCSLLNPVLLIIGNTKRNYDCQFYIQYQNSLIPYEKKT